MLVYIFSAMIGIFDLGAAAYYFITAYKFNDTDRITFAFFFLIITGILCAVTIQIASSTHDEHARSAGENQLPYCEMCGKASDHMDAEYCWNCGSELN